MDVFSAITRQMLRARAIVASSAGQEEAQISKDFLLSIQSFHDFTNTKAKKQGRTDKAIWKGFSRTLNLTLEITDMTSDFHFALKRVSFCSFVKKMMAREGY